MNRGTNPPGDAFDGARHDEDSVPLAAKMAAEAGFPTPWSVNQPVSARTRRLRLEHEARACEKLITDIQQWLVDDDARVRSQARTEVTALLRRLHVGDQNDQRAEPSADSAWTRLPNYLLRHRGANLPGSVPTSLHRQRRTRWVLNWSQLLLALATTAAIATGRPVLALALFAVTVAVDFAEHAFTQLVRNRSVDLRWFSCVTTQVGDAFILTGIAMALALVARPLVAAGVVAAVLTSTVSSLVRVSALQAGHRIWLSRLVRTGRYVAVLVYCGTTAIGLNGTDGAVAAAALVVATGMWELSVVALTILRGEHEPCGQVIVLDADDRVCTYPTGGSVAEEEGSLGWLERGAGQVGV